MVALAGSANRQGRIAADVIASRDSRFRGTQGTSIMGLFRGAAAWTGVSEKTLKRLSETDYERIYLSPNSHAGCRPGAKLIELKVLFRKPDGELLGAQALDEDGPAVDKMNMFDFYASGHGFSGERGIGGFWNTAFVGLPCGIVPVAAFGAPGIFNADPFSFSAMVHHPIDALNRTGFENPFSQGVNSRATATFQAGPLVCRARAA